MLDTASFMEIANKPPIRIRFKPSKKYRQLRVRRSDGADLVFDLSNMPANDGVVEFTWTDIVDMAAAGLGKIIPPQ